MLEVVPAVLGVEAVLAGELLDAVDLLRETGTAADMLDLLPHGRSPLNGFTTSDVVTSTTVRWELR